MTEQYANKAQTTIAEDLDNSETVVTVTSNTGFPTAGSGDQYRVIVDDEIMIVTAKAGGGSVDWTVTRGAEGTAAASHTNGANITHILTSASLLALSERFTYPSKTSAADTPDDNFNSGTLDVKWVAVSGAESAVSLIETGEVERFDLDTVPGALLLQAGAAADQKVELRQDYTLPDGKSIVAAFRSAFASQAFAAGIGSNEQWVGISINDNDAGWDAGEYNAFFMDINSNTSTRMLHFDGTNQSGVDVQYQPGDLWFLRLSRTGSTIRAWLSKDLRTWQFLGSEARSATATNVWIFCEATAGSVDPVPIHACEFILLGDDIDVIPWS